MLVARPPVPLRQVGQGSLISFLGKTPFQLVVPQHPPLTPGHSLMARQPWPRHVHELKILQMFRVSISSVSNICVKEPLPQSPQISLFTSPSRKIISGLFRTPCMCNPSRVKSRLLGDTWPFVHSAARVPQVPGTLLALGIQQ